MTFYRLITFALFELENEKHQPKSIANSEIFCKIIKYFQARMQMQIDCKDSSSGVTSSSFIDYVL